MELTIPANKKMMLIVRMTTTGVVSQFGLTLDVMDDIKMAVEEACHSMMLQLRPFAQLRLSYETAGEILSIHVSGTGERTAQEAGLDLCTLDVMRCILESMVDTVAFQRDDQGICRIDMTKNIAWKQEI